VLSEAPAQRFFGRGHAAIAPDGLIASLPDTISFTVPSRSTTKVVRFARPMIATVPPYCFATFPFASARSGNGSWYCSLNRFCVGTSSTEMPTTCAPLAMIVAYSSRYAWTSRVQPGVKAFG
jgi:hypothetical protein